MAPAKKKDTKAKKPVVRKTAPKTKAPEQVLNLRVPTRGRTFVGTIISAKMHKTVRVEWPRRKYLPKYERFEKRRTRVMAHNPEAINAKQGDRVRIAECRPISKIKKFIVIEVLK